MDYSKKFSQSILKWYYTNKRSMPWRDCGDPYKIWVSEIMLQQTRVNQAEPYFNRFIEQFPTVFDLARSDIHDVLLVWEGLGYYSRARNLHNAAKMVVDEYDGHIPDNWENISKLKGVGPYTASAILSIAFNKPYAVVDGNVIRVLARYFGIGEDVRQNKVKKEIQKIANDLIDHQEPGDFNQAIMELGAVTCTPSNPDCPNCPLNNDCVAYKTAAYDRLPYKSRAKKRPHHHIGVGVILNNRKEVLIALRPEKAMLGNLWEFPGGKKEKGEKIQDTVFREIKEELDIEVKIGPKLMDLKHAYSHFTITLHAFFCSLNSGTPKPKSSQEIRWVPVANLDQYPFPKANRSLIEKLTQQV